MDNKNILLNKIASICKDKHYSLVTAESCTGGGLAYAIVQNPESSSLLERGFIVYSVPSKEELLEVSNYIIQTSGPVSKEVAIEMAKKALEKSKAQVSIAITGLDHKSAKDDGVDKPGIAWISCASTDKKCIVEQHKIDGNREKFCEELIYAALQLLYQYIHH